MALVRRALQLSRIGFSAVAAVFGVLSLWMWAQTVLAWGPEPFAEALFWSLATGLVVAAIIAIEYVENWGE